TRFWSAVKTGTSKDMRDNWCVGFTSRYTVGVWVGNFSGAPMQDVSGVTGAAPVWEELVHYLHREQRSTPPPAPANLVRSRVDFEGGLEPSRAEWFLPNTVLATAAGRPRARWRRRSSIPARAPSLPSTRIFRRPTSW